MAYNANIPQPTDTLNKSQGDLLANFQALQTLIDVNHYDFASGNQGKHMFVSMPVQAADPSTAGNEMALYTKLAGSPLVPHMFIRQQTNGAVVDFTGVNFVPVLPWSIGSQGSTTLPSGLILKWGSNTTPSSGSIGLLTVPFSTPFTSIFVPFAVAANPAGVINNSVTARIYTYSNSQIQVETFFTTSGNHFPVTFSWFAIGI